MAAAAIAPLARPASSLSLLSSPNSSFSLPSSSSFSLSFPCRDPLGPGVSLLSHRSDGDRVIGAALPAGKLHSDQNGSAGGNTLLLEHAGNEREHEEGSADFLRLGGVGKQKYSYAEKFAIRSFEVGMNRTASIESIANLLQEVACNHAQSVGFSTDGFATTPTMRKKRLIWVTTRMLVEIDEYPVWGDVVEIETWCQGEGKVGTRRDWLLTNAATGKRIGRATSTWVMMNEDTRRLGRVTDDIREEYLIYCPDPPRWAFPEKKNCGLKKIPKLEDSAKYIRSGLMPRRGDLDMNQHVNNVTYIGWILESMPQHIIDTHQLHKITLEYRRECTYGDVVKSLANQEPIQCVNGIKSLQTTAINNDGVIVNGIPSIHSSTNTQTILDRVEFLHMLQLNDSGIEINRGRTEWKVKLDRKGNNL